ncbi:hypothetical protein [Planococcus beigongshangi]|uniref:hypothetical protein n=1 Tax=Planococcus beigongshangi TaxID=2782536 RepID=UPI00193BCA23|nr:hypothetical protein [Planococcus beigongshangi]
MRLKETIRNQNGYALLITLLTLMLLTVLGLSLMAMAMNTSKITKSERDSQSSYYIAEAGLVEKRAQINEIARQVYSTLRGDYISMDPLLKKNFEFEKEFNSRVQKSVLDALDLEEDRTYSEQYAASPTSTVTVVNPDAAQPLKYLITSVGRVPSNNGSIKEKTVSQTVEVKVPAATSTEKIEIPGENTVHKFNACYAIKTSQDIVINNGTIKGDIYTDKNFIVPSGNPILEGNIIAKGNATLSGGKPEKDIISYNDTTIDAWINIGGNIVARNNIIIKKGPHNLSKNGKFIYGRNIAFEKGHNAQNNKQEKIEKRNDMDLFLANYSATGGNRCIENIPALPNESLSFPTSRLPLPDNQTIVYTKPKETHEHIYEVLKNGILNIDNWIVRDSNYKLILNEDVYFKEINIDLNEYPLKIDLQNQNRKIYVDKFNNVQGHIELINPGSLEIIVKDSFYSKGKLNIGDKAQTSNFTVRYAGSEGIHLTGESGINGSFYIKNAPYLNIDHISQSGIKGDLVIFGETAVKFGGGASVTENLILAPNSSITLEKGAAIHGNVISKTFAIDGNGSVTPPKQNSGEWQIPGSAPEIIEVPSYDEETTFLITDPLIQK